MNTQKNGLPLWLSLVLFQIGWIWLVLNSDSQAFWWVMLLFAVFFVAEAKAANPPPDQYLARSIILLIGCSADKLAALFGLIQFGPEQTGLPPWMILLWTWFALTFSACYTWLIDRPRLAVAFGAIFGPLAYWGASKISQVEILQPIAFTLLSSIFWAGLFSLAFYHPGFRRKLLGRESLDGHLVDPV